MADYAEQGVFERLVEGYIMNNKVMGKEKMVVVDAGTPPN